MGIVDLLVARGADATRLNGSAEILVRAAPEQVYELLCDVPEWENGARSASAANGSVMRLARTAALASGGITDEDGSDGPPSAR